MRSPHINAQIIQQQNFLRFKDLFQFLHRHHAVLADEICLAYMNTMKWYYLNQFTRYGKSLEKLRLPLLDKSDVPRPRRSVAQVVGAVGLPGGGQPPHDASAGAPHRRAAVAQPAALSSYLAEEDQSTHYLEVPFRSFNLALVDNATAEYTFLAASSAPALSPGTISRHFTYIFDPTFTVGRGLTRTLTAATYDGLGLLLCIRLNQHFAFELQRRRVPARRRLHQRHQHAALAAAAGRHGPPVRERPRPDRRPARPARAPAAAAAVGRPPRRHPALRPAAPRRPSPQRRRRRRRGPSSPASAPTQRNRGLPDPLQPGLVRQGPQKRERFLYNNYSLILTIISDGDGKLAVEQQEHFEGLKAAFQEAE